MNRDTGSSLDTLTHIRQSIADILTTRLGTRCMRRDYGSQLPELVDAPFNDATRLRAYSATVMALMCWEPRVRVSRVQLSDVTFAGQVVMTLDVALVGTGDLLSLSIPLSFGAGQ